MSLDASIDEEGGTTYLERLEDGRPAPDDEYVRREHDRHLRDALAKVRRRVGGMGWDIVHERLAADPPQCLEEIGKRWGVSRERVRQVELTTKQFLARYLDAHRLASASPRPWVSVVAPAARHVRARRVAGPSAPDVRAPYPARRAKARLDSPASDAPSPGRKRRPAVEPAHGA